VAAAQTPNREPLPLRLAQIARALEDRFLGKDEVIRLLLIAVVAGEHAVLVGPPGTAKSALVRTFAKLLDARYFEYLLTRFTEPNEIFGPVDIAAFREGRYERKTKGMLPDAEIVFLDEVFKSNSAILNALLTLLNERRYTSGGAVLECPLLSCFGASNEVPTDETLAAIFDRFLLRIRSENLDAYHFQDLLQRGIENEVASLAQRSVPGLHRPEAVTPLASAREIAELHRAFAARMRFGEEFLATYKGLVFQIRAEGVSLSDRRVVKLLKLFAASAFLDGRAQPDAGDLFVLKHIWNNEDQAQILDAIVSPVLEAHFRDHPQARRVGAVGAGVEALAAEIDRVRQVMTGSAGLSDVQLFSQLKALSEIKTALGASSDPRAPELAKRVDQLLEAAFRSGRFSQLG
jgi:MoxR-like ATPase